ncbi:MAG TPA: hypothetical protein EYH15_02850 [Methanothermococcus okinawensis]|uniref:Thymidylate synthase n=1 Tax=Methanothermococcus okinawensis TaxID=155863 RepID=A0A832ZD90_9EURY|nr:hypothetical protein [Methanothermococcus okinawensis]HIP91109.1 hypothetical protein [Methanothermococcus okinawensis]
MSVAIVSDGKYGHRAYENIKKKFPCAHVVLKYRGNFEDIEIERETLEKLKNFPILITYLRDPDLTYTLIEEINRQKKGDKNPFIIVGIWKGEGFKRQVEKFKNVLCPDLLCNLDEKYLKDKIEEYPQLGEFLKHFGKPKVKIYTTRGVIRDIEVIRDSPCGAVSRTLEEFLGERIGEDTLRRIGLRIQHFCNAGGFKVFSERECKKVKVGEILLEGIEIC